MFQKLIIYLTTITTTIYYWKRIMKQQLI